MILSTVHISDPTFLWCINDYLHDNWFDDEQISLDSDTDKLIVPFYYPNREKYHKVGSGWLAKTLTLPVYESRLIISHVEAWEKKDEAFGGWNDFNKVNYDAEKRRVTIETNGPPLTFNAQVQAFEIMVEISDQVAGEQTVKRLQMLFGAEADGPPKIFKE